MRLLKKKTMHLIIYFIITGDIAISVIPSIGHSVTYTHTYIIIIIIQAYTVYDTRALLQNTLCSFINFRLINNTLYFMFILYKM